MNVHQAGLIAPRNGGVAEARPTCASTAKRLGEILAQCEVAVVPGFLATDGLQSVISLGRGGSDLTAVLLAAGLGANRCELIKDVPGYFTNDPHRDRNALPVPFLTFEHALELADNGCDLVQRAALEAAARWDLPLVVRSLNEKAQRQPHSRHDSRQHLDRFGCESGRGALRQRFRIFEMRNSRVAQRNADVGIFNGTRAQFDRTRKEH